MKRQRLPPFEYIAIDPESIDLDLPDPHAFLPEVAEDPDLDARHTVELLRPGNSSPSPKTPQEPRGGSGGGVSGGLREYKALCEVLLPGLRTQSHLDWLKIAPSGLFGLPGLPEGTLCLAGYECLLGRRSLDRPHSEDLIMGISHPCAIRHLAQLIQRCPWSVSVVLREHGVVIGGTTFRVIRSHSPPARWLAQSLRVPRQSAPRSPPHPTAALWAPE